MHNPTTIIELFAVFQKYMNENLPEFRPDPRIPTMPSPKVHLDYRLTEIEKFIQRKAEAYIFQSSSLSAITHQSIPPNITKFIENFIDNKEIAATDFARFSAELKQINNNQVHNLY